MLAYGFFSYNFNIVFSPFLWFAFQLASSGFGIRNEGTAKNSTLICVPIMAESIDKMVIDVRKAGESGADLVEIRLDTLKIFNPHEDLKTLIKESPVPTLFTYRYLACIFLSALCDVGFLVG